MKRFESSPNATTYLSISSLQPQWLKKPQRCLRWITWKHALDVPTRNCWIVYSSGCQMYPKYRGMSCPRGSLTKHRERLAASDGSPKGQRILARLVGDFNSLLSLPGP